MTEGYLGNQNLKPAGVEVPFFSEEDVKEVCKMLSGSCVFC